MKHKKTGLIAEVENTSHIYRRQNCIASLLPSRRCFYFVWVIKNTEENGLGLTASFQSSTHLTITCRWYDKELHCRRWPPVSLVHPLNVRRVNMQASVDWVMMCAGLLLRRRIIGYSPRVSLFIVYSYFGTLNSSAMVLASMMLATVTYGMSYYHLCKPRTPQRTL